jgi:hypothetical protein
MTTPVTLVWDIDVKKESPQMHHTQVPAPIPQALASVTLGGTLEYGALAVTPLVGNDQPACDYVSLDEALAAGFVTITEVSDSGLVPELSVINRGARPVLIVDGEELIGAKQNRIINLTVLVAAARTTTIPVSCVEAGRWRRNSAHFIASPRTQFASGRAEKMAQVSRSMVDRGVPQSDQGAVWDAIAKKASRMQSHSDTAAMAAIFEQHAHSVNEYVARFAPIDGQRGAIFSLRGRAAGVELFDRADVCRRLMPKLVRSYAIDAVEERASDGASQGSADSLLNNVARAEGRAFPSIGDGIDVRLQAPSLVGGALVVAGRVVHLAAFAAAA